MAKVTMKGLEQYQRIRSERPVKAFGDDAALAARADALGNRDGQVSSEELEALAADIFQKFQQIQNQPGTTAEALQRMLGDYQRLTQLVVARQSAANQADEFVTLAQKISNRDGKLSRSEVEAFVRDRYARADEAEAAGNSEAADQERTLAELGMEMLKTRELWAR